MTKHLIAIVIIIVVIITFSHNFNRIKLCIQSLLHISNISSMPLHKKNTDILINYLIKDENVYEKFIDFGCGSGNIISQLIKSNYKINKIIGIEICKLSYKKALKYTKYKNVFIKNMSMVDYKFTNVPTILYFYEPLWNMKNNLLKKQIYTTIFNNFKHVKNITIIYITSSYTSDLKDPFFISNNLVLKTRFKIAGDIPFIKTATFNVWIRK